ncbi:spore cortex biosynthesis protein YabQ [Halobacillus campisalis]|uniref:Spore cortex biosynthesis protein YabQ n=1 Tax=Halobacillus campisalis TaxID=435909 RepID=A0ABW2K7L6_9BACI|nr:spore cortex biosynthesis protein YabQ [Halobacillus campisalis]
MTLTTQFMTMISMIAGGIYIGMAADTFERLFYKRNKKSWLEFVWQSAFWITQAAFLFYILYKVNYGEMRVYIAVALLCGYAAYRALLQELYHRWLEFWIRVILRILRFMKRLFNVLVVWPLMAVVVLSKNVLFLVYRVLYKGIYIVFIVAFSPFLFIFRIVWKLLPINTKKFLHKIGGFYVTIKNIIKNWTGSKKE